MNDDTTRPEYSGKLAQFKINRLLGQGGMGRVYLAEDRRLKRKVAIKIVQGEGRERFLRGARAIAGIRHPNICEVYDYGEENGVVFIITPFLEGETLQVYGSKKSLAPGEALEILKQIAEGVRVLHQNNVIHRDLKPGNVMISDRPVLIDFGLALKLDDAQMTEGLVVGTPEFMSPEQARGHKPKKSFDLWGLARIADDLQPMPNAHLKSVLVRALAPEEHQRFQTIEEFQEALENDSTQLEIRKTLPKIKIDSGLFLLTCGIVLMLILIYYVSRLE